jgi:hypothetical protein
VTHGLEAIGADPKTARPYLMLEGNDLSAWDVGAAGLVMFTLLLAINGDRYSDAVLSAFAERCRRAGMAYLCAWGPGCSRVHDVFDREFVNEEIRGVRGADVMTTCHERERLAEALWFATDLGFHEDVRDPGESAVVIGTDRDEWRTEIRTRLQDVDELRRYVVEDLPG